MHRFAAKHQSIRPNPIGLLALLLMLWAFSAGTLAVAQAPGAPAPVAGASNQIFEALNRPGDLTLRNSSLEAALFTISELWNVNIVVGQVEGTVTGVFKEAPLREILDSILLSNGYSYQPVGRSLVINSIEELGQLNPYFVSDTIRVEAASIDDVLSAAELLSSPQGEVRAIPSAGSIVVVDYPDRVSKIRDLVEQIDAATGGPSGGVAAPRELEVAYFRTHYIPAQEAQLALAVVLSPVGQISAIEKEDRLLVVDYAANVQMIHSVLKRIDRPRPQVNIKALIYDINLTDLEEIGMNWNLLSRGQVNADGGPVSGSGIQVNALNKTPFDAGSNGSSFSFFSIENDINLEAVILALQQAEDSRLLADPSVTVLDNETALIESIEEIPFQQLTQTAAGGQIGTTAFRDAGIKLEVLPKIARDGTIDMIVTPEFSRLTGFTPNDNQPIIDRRIATTRVRIANQQTLMIAGLRRRSDTGEFNGVPMLKDLRFFGHLFRARDTQIEESELVVFLTPEIVGFADPLGYREQLTADTVQCRIDHIPTAEGCCPHGTPIGGSCPTCDPSCNEATPLPYPSTQPTPAYEEIPAVQSSQKEDGSLVYPSLTSKSSASSKEPTEARLPNYDSRFSAKGKKFGKYATPEEKAEEQEAIEKTSIKPVWYERMFR